VTAAYLTPFRGRARAAWGQRSSHRCNTACRCCRRGRQRDLADEFLNLAREVNASFLVIGLRHRSQVGKFIMVSHAQRILIQADRPVLAVKADGAGR